MKVFLIGYFGSGNLGDELIYESFTAWLRATFDKVEIRALRSSDKTQPPAPDITAVDKNDFRAIRAAINWADIIVAPGGGLVQDSTSVKSALFYLSIAYLAYRAGKPFHMLSQGLGPFCHQPVSWLAGRILGRACHCLHLRDEAALRTAHELGLDDSRFALTADLAFMRTSDAPKSKKASGTTFKIAVSLRPATGVSPLSEALFDCLTAFATVNEIEAHVLVLDPDEDSAICREFASRLASSGIKTFLYPSEPTTLISPTGTLELLSGMNITLGMRLHSLILSTIAGTPFVAFSYDPKVGAFATGCDMPGFTDLPAITSEKIREAMRNALTEERMDNQRKYTDYATEAVRTSLEKFAASARAAADSPNGKTRVLGVPVSTRAFDETADLIVAHARGKKPLQVVTVNPEMIMRARREPEFRALLTGGTLNTADGVGIRIAALAKYRRKIEAVTGVELAERILQISRAEKLRVFIIGSKPEVMDKAAAIAHAHPARPIIAGAHHGYIKNTPPEKLIAGIAATRPDIVLAGMGVPMQEYWLRDFGAATGASVLIGVGGTFDAMAGVTTRAPMFMRKTGMEWLWRLAHEPSRIGRMAVFPYYLILAMCDALLDRGKTK